MIGLIQSCPQSMQWHHSEQVKRTAQIEKVAGENATVTGTANGETIDVSSISAARLARKYVLCRPQH